MKAIEGLEISKDENRPLKKVKTSDSTYSSQHDSLHSSVSDLQWQDSGNDSTMINMVQSIEIEAKCQTTSAKVAVEEGPVAPRCLPPPLESSEDLSHYIFLVKNLLHEVEVLQYKLDHQIRETFRDSIKDAHIRTTDILTARHGHQRIFRVFNEALQEHANVSN